MGETLHFLNYAYWDFAFKLMGMRTPDHSHTALWGLLTSFSGLELSALKYVK